MIIMKAPKTLTLVASFSVLLTIINMVANNCSGPTKGSERIIKYLIHKLWPCGSFGSLQLQSSTFDANDYTTTKPTVRPSSPTSNKMADAFDSPESDSSYLFA